MTTLKASKLANSLMSYTSHLSLGIAISGIQAVGLRKLVGLLLGRQPRLGEAFGNPFDVLFPEGLSAKMFSERVFRIDFF
jgi:hypothetical protein